MEDPGSIPGSGISPGEEDSNPLQYSGLENSMNRGAWQAPVHGVSKSQTWLSDLHFHFSLSYCSLRIYRNSLNKTPSFWLTEKGNERKLTWWGANWELTIRKALSEEMTLKYSHLSWFTLNVISSVALMCPHLRQSHPYFKKKPLALFTCLQDSTFSEITMSLWLFK